MFELISEDDYKRGLVLLKRDYETQQILNYTHGESFIWLEKSI